MKLNATTEMEPISIQALPICTFAPVEDAQGYLAMIEVLESWLAELTGYAKVSIQPNAGSQGELAGLLAIRAYHESRGDHQRRICLIPRRRTVRMPPPPPWRASRLLSSRLPSMAVSTWKICGPRSLITMINLRRSW